MTEPNPSNIMQVGLGFWAWKTLLSAVKFFFHRAHPAADDGKANRGKARAAPSRYMLIEFGEAFDFSGSDFDGWCREVGFERTEVLHLAGPASTGIAYKAK